MKKIEVHCKTKYSKDYDSLIDIESIIWNAKENKEKGIIFIDKDTIYSFPKIERIYKKIIEKDKSFNNFKIGYGVQLTSKVGNDKCEVLLLINKQVGLNNIYKIMNNYTDNIDINEIIKNKEGLLLGLIYKEDINVDTSIFDYIEINEVIDYSKIKNKLIVYSNIPNSLYEGDVKGREVLNTYRNVKNNIECRLYLDTEDTLNYVNNEEIVITNSNKLFDNLDYIKINDDTLHIPNTINYKDFKKQVIKSFNNMYSSPSKEIINRLDNELYLVNELNYVYYFNLLLTITDYCKKNNESYLLDGYINNSLIAYILGITKIEPYNLPYELFYSNNLKINIIINPEFYYKKLYKYISNKCNLVKCRYGFKINNKNVFRVIKNYELKTHNFLDLNTKDYISNLLVDIPLYNDLYSNSFYILPNDYLIPYNNEGTIYDYHELSNNLIMIKFLPNKKIKYNSDIIIHNNKEVYNLIRTTKEKIPYFDDLKYELENKPNLWFDDLIDILAKKHGLLIEDNLFNYLKSLNLDDINIFSILNRLKDKEIIIPKSNLINKCHIAYIYAYKKYLGE